MEDRVYSVRELAEILKLSTITIRKEINKGNIKHVLISGSIRITDRELNRILGED